MIIKYNGFDIEATVDEVRALLQETADMGEEPQEPESDPEPKILEKKQIRKKPIRKKKLDHGMILALHNAGWPATKIADEMKASPNTIRNILKRLKEDNNA